MGPQDTKCTPAPSTCPWVTTATSSPPMNQAAPNSMERLPLASHAARCSAGTPLRGVGELPYCRMPLSDNLVPESMTVWGRRARGLTSCRPAGRTVPRTARPAIGVQVGTLSAHNRLGLGRMCTLGESHRSFRLRRHRAHRPVRRPSARRLARPRPAPQGQLPPRRQRPWRWVPRLPAASQSTPPTSPPLEAAPRQRAGTASPVVVEHEGRQRGHRTRLAELLAAIGPLTHAEHQTTTAQQPSHNSRRSTEHPCRQPSTHLR